MVGGTLQRILANRWREIDVERCTRWGRGFEEQLDYYYFLLRLVSCLGRAARPVRGMGCVMYAAEDRGVSLFCARVAVRTRVTGGQHESGVGFGRRAGACTLENSPYAQTGNRCSETRDSPLCCGSAVPSAISRSNGAVWRMLTDTPANRSPARFQSSLPRNVRNVRTYF